MFPRVQHRNRIVRVDTTELVKNALAKTYLSADISSSSSTLTVEDIAKFSTGSYVWINPFSETSEIIAVHASTSPSGTTITLASNTSFEHFAGEEVYYIEYDQVEVSHASTVGGSKSVLDTVSIDAGSKETRYLDTAQSSGFYFARFKDSVGSTFSSYSDGVAHGGWDQNTVGHMIEQALRNNDRELGENLTLNDCFEFINDGLDEVQGKQLRFPQHQKLNSIIGQTTRGIRTISLPTDIYDNDTIKSIMGVRIGEDKNLEFLDPDEFEQALAETKETQVRTQASSGSTTLAVDNSYDFNDSGSLSFYISGTKHTITYTGVTRDDADGGTAEFTGIPSSGDDSISVTVPVDTNIFQGETEGEPSFFTVRNGNLEYHPMPDEKHDNMNVYMDYFTVATEVDSEGDEIDLQRYRIVLYYLTWRIWCRAHNNNVLDERSGWHRKYKERLNDAIRTNRSVFTHKMMPKLNRINFRRSYPNNARGNKSSE